MGSKVETETPIVRIMDGDYKTIITIGAMGRK